MKSLRHLLSCGLLLLCGAAGTAAEAVPDVAALESKAAAGDRRAICDLARLHISGQGGARDEAKAAELLKPLAEGSFPRAQSLFGYLLINSKGPLKNEAEGVRWTRAAAESGEASAQLNLGILHLKGTHGVAKDPVAGVDWLGKAAEQRNLEALKRLVDLYYFGGDGVMRDYEKALTWVKPAAESGDAWAQNVFGTMWEHGQGVALDRKAAQHWFRLAAEQGNAKAMSALGRLYAGGIDIPRDPEEAYFWLQWSAFKGEITALNYLPGFARGLTDEQMDRVHKRLRDKRVMPIHIPRPILPPEPEAPEAGE
jgi:TPR repeat protein